MQDLVRFLDRQGEYKEMHIISMRPVMDTDSEELVIDMSGIDDTVIISLSEAKVDKLIKALFDARSAIKDIRARKRRRVKSATQLSDEDMEQLSNTDIDDLYKGTLFAK